MKQIFSLIILFTVFTVQAESQNIIALVNDDPITNYEFESRRKMLMKLNNIQNPDSKTDKELSDYALQTLIDESILEQHANNVGGRVSAEEIDDAIGTIEKKNNMPAGHLIRSFGDKAIERSFKSQIKAELIKMNILSYLSKSIVISPKEIDVAILTANSKDLKILAKIFVSKDRDEKSLSKMNSLRKQIKNCNDMKKSSYEKFASITDVEQDLSAFDAQAQTIIKDLNINQASRVFETSKGFEIAIICKKEFHNITNEENTYITNFLTNRKMSRKAQEFFDKLRKKTFIKIMNS